MTRTDVRRKLQAQLDEAHEAIDVLRAENARLNQGVKDVLRFHDGCICRHARRFLRAAAIEAEIDGHKVSELETLLRETTAVLDSEIEQHEAFYLQSGTKSEIHEQGIASAKALVRRLT